MRIIKPQYIKPVLTLCNSNKTPMTHLSSRTGKGAYDITLTETINECAALSFKMIFDNNKLSHDDCERLVKLGFDYYVIKEVNTTDSANNTIQVTCQHESVELKGIICEIINEIGISVDAMFNVIMTSASDTDLGYKFAGTDVPLTKKRSLQCDTEQSVYENLVQMAKVFDGWLEFSTDVTGQKWIYLRTQTIKRGKFVKKGKDLKQLDITYNSDAIFTRLEAFGNTDSDGVELNIMGVNPTKQSYVADYSYYLAQGMTMAEILKTPRCLQRSIFRDSLYVDANDLYQVALDELKKCCVPKLDATLDMTDVSIWEGSAVLAPIIGEEIIVVDKDIKFNISCRITGIERNFSKPSEPKLTISNVVKYDTVFKDLMHSADIIDKLTSTDANTGYPILMAQYVQGKIDAHVASIVGMLDTIEKPEDKYAILFECRIVGHKLFGALALGSSGMLCANQLDAKGAWIWRTAISATGVSATEINTGCLNATIIKAGVLQSLDGGTWINMENGTFNFQNKVKFDGTKFSITLNSGKDLDAKLTEFSVEDGRLNSLISDPTTGLQTQITQTNKDIALKAEDLGKKIAAVKITADGVYTSIESTDGLRKQMATIKATADAVTTTVGDANGGLVQKLSTVKQTADGVYTSIEDASTGLRTQISAMANGLKSRVSNEYNASIISQAYDAVEVNFEDMYNDISEYVHIDSTGLKLGNIANDDYTKISSQGLLHVGNNGTERYHYLSDGGVRYIHCTDSNYTRVYISLPYKFRGLSDSQIKVMCSVRKVYDTDIDDYNNLPFWFGCYASVSGGQIICDVMSKWRRIRYDSNDDSKWVKEIDGAYNGNIDIAYVIIA